MLGTTRACNGSRRGGAARRVLPSAVHPAGL